MFEIGQQVVCISDGWDPIPGLITQPSSMPVKDCVYTVRDIYEAPTRNLYLRLVEILGGSTAEGLEPVFRAKFFRPVKKTNIDVFTALLVTPPKVRIVEPV